MPCSLPSSLPIWPCCRWGSRQSDCRGKSLRIPRRVLMPLILMFCMVGAFAINNTVFGITVMLVLGILAYLMEENGFPVAPAILGIVLGGMVEDNFMASMIKADGSLLGFFSRPIAATLGVITILLWLTPILAASWRYLNRHKSRPVRQKSDP